MPLTEDGGYEVKYICGPVTKRFHEDRQSRVKLIIGPFGTGKTSAGAFDIIECQSRRVRPSNGLRKSRFAVVRNCYDDQTEILTEFRGFQLFRDLTRGDRVATLQGENIVYVKPDGVSASPYVGEMLGFEGEGVNFLVTPDHEMWVSKRRTRGKVWGGFEMKRAHEIYGNTLFRVRRDAKWQGSDVGMSDAAFEWLGFYYAEGSYGVYGNRPRCIITQTKPEGIRYARGLFTRAGLEFKEWRRKEGINFSLVDSSQLSERMFEIASSAGRAHNKKVALEILSAEPSRLRSFIEGFRMGDGHTRRDGTTTTLFTSSKSMSDDLQEMALKAGYVANISTRDRTGNAVRIGGVIGRVNHPEHTITLLNEKKYRPVLRCDKKTTNHLRGWYRQDYSGTVYCAEMSDPTVYVRRKGKAFWCNRTYPELRDTTIKTYLDWWPPGVFGTYNSTEKRYVVRIGDREIEIIFKALDTPKDVRDLLSLELTGAHVDEAREIHQDVVKGLLGRIGRYPSLKDTGGIDPFLSPPQVLLSTNYPSTRHPLYRDFVSHRIDGYTIYEQKQSENKHNLRKGYYEDLERDYASRPDLLRTLVRGEWGVTVEGRAVYTPNEFNRGVHVAKSSLFPQEPTLIIRGWDNTGLAPAIILTYFSTWGQWRPFKEFCFKDTGIMDAAEAVIHYCLQQLPPGCKFRDIADPAGRTRDSMKQSPADYIAQKSQQMGHYIRLEEGIQTFKSRREAVANRLTRMINGQPAILIDPSCETLIEGFEGGYAYPEIGNSGEFRTEPMKNDYSHIQDSLQYPATRLFTHSDIDQDEDDERERSRMVNEQGRSQIGGY